MNSAYRRHDISDEVWMLLEPYLADQNSRHESCNTAPQEPKNAKRLLYDPELYRLRHMSHCREYIFASQTMARHSYALCQNFSILFCGHSNPIYRSPG